MGNQWSRNYPLSIQALVLPDNSGQSSEEEKIKVESQPGVPIDSTRALLKLNPVRNRFLDRKILQKPTKITKSDESTPLRFLLFLLFKSHPRIPVLRGYSPPVLRLRLAALRPSRPP
jgi:hypothetical protein